MTDIFGNSGNLAAVEAKTQNQTAVPGTTDFTGQLEENGVDVATLSDLGSYLPLSGGTMTGAINLGTKNLSNVGTISGAVNARTCDNIMSNSGTGVAGNVPIFVSSKVIQDSGTALTSLATTASLGAYLPLAGGTMSGSINLGTNNLTNVSRINTPTNLINFGNTNTVPAGGASAVVVGHSSNTSGGVGSTLFGRQNTVTGSNSVVNGYSNAVPASTTVVTGYLNFLNSVGSSAIFGYSNNNTASINGASNIFGDNNTDSTNFGGSTIIGSLNTNGLASISVMLGRGNIIANGTSKAVTLGTGLTNNISDSVILGHGTGTSNIRAGGTACDLGITTNPFQNLYLNKGLYMLGTTVPANVASNGAIYTKATTENGVYVYNSIEYPFAGNNYQKTGRGDGTLSQNLWTDGFITINWDSVNKQPRFNIASGTTWQGSPGVQVSSYLSFSSSAPSTQIVVINPLVALTNYYVASNSATGVRVPGMDMNHVGGDSGKFRFAPASGTSSTIHWISFDILASGTVVPSVINYIVRKHNAN